MTIVVNSPVFEISHAKYVLHERSFDGEVAEGVCIQNTVACPKSLPAGEYVLWLSDIAGVHIRSAVSIIHAVILEPLVVKVQESTSNDTVLIVYLESKQLFRITIMDLTGDVIPQEQITLMAENRTIQLTANQRGSILLLDNPTGHLIDVAPGISILVENITPRP